MRRLVKLQSGGRGSIWRQEQIISCLATSEWTVKYLITFLAISRNFLKKSSEAWLSPPSDCIGSIMIPATIFFFFLYFTIRSSTCKSNIYATFSFLTFWHFFSRMIKPQHQHVNSSNLLLAIKVSGTTRNPQILHPGFNVTLLFLNNEV